MNDRASDTAQRIKDYSNAAYNNYETKNIKVIPRVILMYTDGNTPAHEYWPSDLTDGDWTSQAVRDRVVAVVRKLGEAWDNDSRIAWVQMGIIGQWGEQESPVGIDDDLGGGVTWAKILEPVFKEAFPNKKVLVRSPEKWGADFHVGMYWDTFASNGKMNGPTDEWNRIKANNLAPRESYKKAPIEGEVAYNFVLANQMGTSPEATLQNANYRQFFIDTVRSTATTACGIEFDPSISANSFGASEIQKVFGYRFLLKEFTCANRVEPGATLNFSAKVVNAGSAPTYAKNWPLSVVLIDEATKQIVWTSPAVPNVDITQWLPGTGYQWNFVDGQLGTGSRTYANPAPTNVVTGAVTIPSNLATSSYLVGLSILDPTTGKPGIYFSVTNFLQASNTQPLARIGVGMNAGTGAIAFDPYNWLNDTRRYNLTSGPAPTTVTIAATDATAAEPSNNGTFTFTRTGSTAAALTVNFTVSGTATSGSDYTALGTSVTIAAGQASATKTLTVIDDTTNESSETAIVTLASGAGYTIGSPSSATVNIADNDVPPALPSVTVSATDAAAGEPANTGTYTFTRTGDTSAALTVNFTVSGTATSGSDYTALGTSVTIAAGQASATQTLTVIDDAMVESSETAIVTLASNAAYTIGTPSSATVNIADNEVPVGEAAPWSETFTYANGTTSHGAPTTWTATNMSVLTNEMSFNNVGADGVFTTGAINISSGPVTVSLKVRGGTGLDVGQDFLRLYKKVDGGAEVQIGAADGPQAAATWTANITSGSSLVLVVRSHVTSTAEFYYFDDLSVTGSAPVLPTVTVAATDATAGEPANSGTYTFTRTGSTVAALTVNYTVSGTATGGTDYTALGTSVTIAAGQANATKTLAVIDDTTVESSETAIVTLASDAAYTISTPSSATVNIADNDTGLPSPWVTADIGAVGATGSASYTSPTWTITGSGADIWGTADEFRYVYQSSSGDCSIVARVASIQNTNAWAKAAVMIRETTAANAQSAMLCVSPSSGVSFQYRTTTGGTTVTNLTVTGQTPPKWLKITRTGNVFAAYRSDNGTTWTQVGTAQTINMATSTTIGLALTSHADGTLCTSTMDNVTATP